MATKNQVFDMMPVGMKFTVLQASADTSGKSLDLHWELPPKCKMKNPLVHIHPHAIETYEVLDILTNNRTKDFKRNLKTTLCMSVLANKYRNEIIAKNPPDAVIKFLSFISNLVGIKY